VQRQKASPTALRRWELTPPWEHEREYANRKKEKHTEAARYKICRKKHLVSPTQANDFCYKPYKPGKIPTYTGSRCVQKWGQIKESSSTGVTVF
jgi:hypothetical protein